MNLVDEIFGRRFFEALRHIAEFKLGRDHPCVAAVARAAETGAGADIEAAQKEFSALPGEVSDAMMQAVHKTLREDPAALLDLWAAPGNPRQTN